MCAGVGCEGATDGGPPLAAGEEEFGGAGARACEEGGCERDTEKACEGAGDEGGLVVAACAEAGGVDGDGDDGVEGEVGEGGEGERGEAGGEEGGEAGEAVVLEEEDGGAEGVVVEGEGAGAGEGVGVGAAEAAEEGRGGGRRSGERGRRGGRGGGRGRRGGGGRRRRWRGGGGGEGVWREGAAAGIAKRGAEGFDFGDAGVADGDEGGVIEHAAADAAGGGHEDTRTRGGDVGGDFTRR